MKSNEYGGRVIAINKVTEGDKFDAKFAKAVEEFIDQDNEVRVALVGDTYNIIQHPIVRVKSPPSRAVKAPIYDPHKGLFKKGRKSNPQVKK